MISSISAKTLKIGVQRFLDYQSSEYLDGHSGLCSEFSHHTDDIDIYMTMKKILGEDIYNNGISRNGHYSDHRMFFAMFLNELTAEELIEMFE